MANNKDTVTQRFEVQRFIGKKWENVRSPDGEPQTFPSHKEARAALNALLRDVRWAHERGDLSGLAYRDEFRVVPVDPSPDHYQGPEDFEAPPQASDYETDAEYWAAVDQYHSHNTGGSTAAATASNGDTVIIAQTTRKDLTKPPGC